MAITTTETAILNSTEKVISFLSVSYAFSNSFAPKSLPIMIHILAPREMKDMFARFITVEDML